MLEWSLRETAWLPFLMHRELRCRIQSAQARRCRGHFGAVCHCLLTCKQVYKSTMEPEGKPGATNCSARFGVCYGWLYCKGHLRAFVFGSIRLHS